jgi:predicted nucleic acid-binding protein
MKKRLLILVALMALLCVCFTGCRKPYDKPELVTIEASQTAFLIPLVGDTSDQGVFESEELLQEAKIATKEIQIPHRWVQTGRKSYTGEWRPSATLIVVERKPVSRSWESGETSATSANRAIFGETSDNIGIYVGMNCTAMIEEKDAAKFLYRYNNTPLETIIDTDIKKMVEDRFNIETAKYASTELGAKKGEIMETVKTYVVSYFEEYGITITVLGLKEGISFENPAIQTAIDQKFASEQKLEIQQNENAANIAKAEAEAQAILIAAQSQAEANRVLSESLTQEILTQMYYEKWDGKLPYLYGADGDTLIQVPNP